MSYRPAGPLDLMNMLAAVEAQENGDSQDQQIRAQANAQVCHAFGVKFADMTPSQRALAGAIERSMKGKPEARYPGFRIDPSGRKPTVK